MKRHIPGSPDGGLDSLIADALKHLDKLGYKPGTIGNYRYAWHEFLSFAQGHLEKEGLCAHLVHEFLESEGISAAGETELTFRQRHIRTVMRVLTEFALHGCVQRRSGTAEKVKLPADMAALLFGYEKFCRESLRSPTETLRKRKRDIVRFLHYLDSSGVTSFNQVQASAFSGFVRSLAHLKSTTVAGVVSSLRSFLRYLCMQGFVSGDLVEQVPKVRIRRDERIPTVWRKKDVDSLLAAVDRNCPCGKRDYAILLLAARLGMRVSDVRALRFEHLLWDQARIEIRQAKGGAPLILPLTEEIGDALIDYLRHGRPPSNHREVFLRANAPFEPFGNNNNLHHVITKYRRRARIALPARNRRGLHSLRHTMASQLLEAGTPLETISAIMGHLSVETTRIYTKVDVEALRSVAIDPEEVFHG